MTIRDSGLLFAPNTQLEGNSRHWWGKCPRELTCDKNSLIGHI